MKIYNRSARVALHYQLRIVAALIVLAPQLVLADEPPISEDHWPVAHVYRPAISKAVAR